MTPDPVLLIAGTHGYDGDHADTVQWWWPGDGASLPSPWVQEARRRGLTILGDPGAPFVWSSDLTGALPRLFRRSAALTAWKAAGEAVREYCWARGVRRVQLVAHSHGGQVAAYAAARRLTGFHVSGLVTVATPVRGDMAPIYKAPGRVPPGGSTSSRRAPPTGGSSLASSSTGRGAGGGRCPGRATTRRWRGGHSALMGVEVWNRQDWWRFLR